MEGRHSGSVPWGNSEWFLISGMGVGEILASAWRRCEIGKKTSMMRAGKDARRQDVLALIRVKIVVSAVSCTRAAASHMNMNFGKINLEVLGEMFQISMWLRQYRAGAWVLAARAVLSHWELVPITNIVHLSLAQVLGAYFDICTFAMWHQVSYSVCSSDSTRARALG